MSLVDPAIFAAHVAASPSTTASRQCGSCSLCCKLLAVVEADFAKPANTWCQHCRPGKGGCTIYEDRPRICRGFKCQWLISPHLLGEEWRPDRSKIVVYGKTDLFTEVPRLTFLVDPSYPDRWRDAPYYAAIKKISRLGLEGKLRDDAEQITTYVVARRRWLILPNEDVDITEASVHTVHRVGPDEWQCFLFDDIAEAKSFKDRVELGSVMRRT